MGLFAPPAAFLSQRLGSRQALAAALALIGAFGIARAFVPGAALLILLTIPVGIGMGLGNALLPVGVKERFSDRPVFATGVYAAGINVGATLSAASAVPLARGLGTWRDALLVFSSVTLGLLVLWLVLTRVERGHVASSVPRPLALPWRSSLGWRLVAAFFFMSATYYGLNAWLPDVYVERGWSEGKAGALLAVLNATQIVAGLSVAWLADRMWSRRTWMAACSGLGVLSLLGVVLLPGGGFLWAFMLGATIGPLFSLTMALPLDIGRGPAEVAAYTGLMLGAGYSLSAMSPLVLGAIRDASSGFGVVLWVLVGLGAALFAVDSSLTPARLAAARRSHEPRPRAASS
jgi:CP family cyanate transporter-like MFS transporter